jgi:nitrogen regulatory protein PII
MRERRSVLGRYGVPREEARLITCVLYRGASRKVLKALTARGLNAASMHHARGSSIGDPVGRRGLPIQHKKEILNVVVAPEECDEVLHLIFRVADIDRPTGGFMYVRRLARAMPYMLPDVPDETEDEN